MDIWTAPFLIMLLAKSGGGWHLHQHRMPNWDQCFIAVNTAKVSVSNGDENEAAVVVYCAAGPVDISRIDPAQRK